MTGLGIGVAIGLVDRHGVPIHIGDTLRFDEREFGEPHTFTITLERGEIEMSGAPDDMDQYCEVITRFDGTKVRD